LTENNSPIIHIIMSSDPINLNPHKINLKVNTINVQPIKATLINQMKNFFTSIRNEIHH
jgi:hypothetical protein